MPTTDQAFGIAVEWHHAHPQHPEYGSIEMVFTSGPTELRQWVIRDDSGAETTVILGEMKKGAKLKPSLFNITVATDKRK